MIKIKDLPVGMIIWQKNNILGITKDTLPEKYYDYYCFKILGSNDFDYEILIEKVEEED